MFRSTKGMLVTMEGNFRMARYFVIFLQSIYEFTTLLSLSD